MSSSTRLYLVRHGETAWSATGQHTGRTDVPLTEKGEQEARGLAKQLGSVGFDHVFTSPLQRARRTCELVGLSPALELLPDAVEWDYGEYEGQRSAEIRKSRPDWNIFRDGCPGGERPNQISDRADRVITKVRALNGNIAIVAHGHFCRVLAVRWIGLPVLQAQRFVLTTASLSVLGYDHNRADEPVIMRWNHTETAASARR